MLRYLNMLLKEGVNLENFYMDLLNSEFEDKRKDKVQCRSIRTPKITSHG